MKPGLVQLVPLPPAALKQTPMLPAPGLQVGVQAPSLSLHPAVELYLGSQSSFHPIAPKRCSGVLGLSTVVILMTKVASSFCSVDSWAISGPTLTAF